MGVSRSSGCMTYHRLQSVNRSLTLAPSNLNARPSPCTSVYSADTCADARSCSDQPASPLRGHNWLSALTDQGRTLFDTLPPPNA